MLASIANGKIQDKSANILALEVDTMKCDINYCKEKFPTCHEWIDVRGRNSFQEAQT